MKIKPFDRKTTFFKNLRLCTECAFPYWRTEFINKDFFPIIATYPMYPEALEDKRLLAWYRGQMMERYQKSDEYRCNPWRYKECPTKVKK